MGYIKGLWKDTETGYIKGLWEGTETGHIKGLSKVTKMRRGSGSLKFSGCAEMAKCDTI